MKPSKTLFLYLSLVFICGLVPKGATSQKILHNNSNIIAYDGKRMDYTEAGDIFQKVTHSVYYYEQSLQQLKSAKTAGKVTAAIGIGGLLLIAADNSEWSAGLGISRGDVSGVIMILLGVPISGITSLVIRGKADRTKIRAIQIFNGNQSFGYHDVPLLELSLASTSNGVGLVLRF